MAQLRQLCPGPLAEPVGAGGMGRQVAGQGEEGSWRGRGRMCDYDWFALSYDRNKHTIAKKI